MERLQSKLQARLRDGPRRFDGAGSGRRWTREGPWSGLWAPVWRRILSWYVLGSRLGVHTKGPCFGL